MNWKRAAQSIAVVMFLSFAVATAQAQGKNKKLAKGNKVGEVVVTPDGQITESPKWRKRGSKED